MNKKIWALLEVTAVRFGLKLAVMVAAPFMASRYGFWIGNASGGLLWTLPALLLMVLHGKKWAEFGLDLRQNWRLAVHFGFWAMVLKVFFEAPGFILWKKLGPPGFGLLLLLVSGSIVLMLWMFRKEPQWPRIDWKIILMVVLLLLPGIVALMMHKDLSRVLRWQFHFLVWVGFAEEFLNRGYIQSRLNLAFGRPWKIWGTQFGPGLIWASVLFGVSHIYQLGASEINILMGIGATFGGLFFGIIREKTGSILAPAIAHGIACAAGEIYGFMG